MHTAQDIEQAIRAAANPDKVKTLSGFFKTGKGEYGEQDIFIGIPVPVTRSIVKQYLDTPLDQLEILLHNPVHELRMSALLCMVEQFKKADANRREAIYHTYLSNTAYIQLLLLYCFFLIVFFSLTVHISVFFRLPALICIFVLPICLLWMQMDYRLLLRVHLLLRFMMHRNHSVKSEW